MTLSVQPNSVIEGDGVVDVVITASVEAAVTGSALSITLGEGTGSATTMTDYTIAGHVNNAGTQSQDTGAGLPTLTIPVGQTSTRGVLQIIVPADADSAAEEIVLTGRVSDPDNYRHPADLTITVGTEEFADSETRYAEKQLHVGNSGPLYGWDILHVLANGFLSSTGFRANSQDYTFVLIEAEVRGNRSELIVGLGQQLPSSIVNNLWLRFDTGGVTTDLPFRDAEEEDLGTDPAEFHYTWTRSKTPNLPTLAENSMVTITVMRVDVPVSFGDRTVANQQWHRDETIELALPTVTAGDLPIEYELTGTLPTDVNYYEAEDEVPGSVQYSGTFPVILGTPTAEFTTTPYTYRATDADGDSVELRFEAGVAMPAPANLQLTPGQLAFMLSWQAPTPESTSSITVTGYRIEKYTSRSGGPFPATPLVTDTNSTATTYTDTDFASADAVDGITATYRVSAISAGGISSPSDEATSVAVTGTPAVLGVSATAAGPQIVELTWVAPATKDASIDGYAIRRTDVASGRGAASWTTVTANTGSPGVTVSDRSNDLRADTTYYYQVAAVSGSDTWAWSADATVTMSAAVKPAALAIPVLDESGYTRITVNWAVPEFDGGADITGYLLEESSDANTWAVLVRVANDVTSYTHGMLADDARVYYRVAALNGVDDDDPNFSPSIRGLPTPRTVVNFTVASASQSTDEGTAPGVTITVAAATSTGSTIFTVPLRQTFGGNATAADIGSIAAADDVSELDAVNGLFSLNLAGDDATFTVVAQNDDFWDPGETVTFALDMEHASWPEALRVGDRGTVTVALNDQDTAPTVTLSVSPRALAEQGGANETTVRATVIFADPPGYFQTNHRLVFDFSGGAAEEGVTDDFTSSVPHITLPMGAAQPTETATLTVHSNTDDDDNARETINVDGAVQTLGGAAVAAVTVTGDAATIVGTLTASISFDNLDAVAEPSTGHAFTLELSATPTVNFPLTVNVGGEVTAADHSTPTLALHTFAAGTEDLDQSGTIDILDDAVAEVDEDLTLTLTSGRLPSGAAIDPAGATVNLTDSDSVTASIRRPAGQTATAVVEGESLVFEVVLSGAVGVPVAVPWSISGTGVDSNDFGDPLSGTVNFSAADDVASPTRTVTVNSVVNTDSGTGSESFTVTLGTAIVSDLGSRVTVAEAPSNAVNGALVEPDATGPAVESVIIPGRVNADAFPATITFDEDVRVSTFTSHDISVFNGRPGEPSATPADQRRIFTTTITPDANLNEDDVIAVQVLGGDVRDDSGNANSASATATAIFDSVAPTPMLTTEPVAPLNEDFILTIDFGEAVQNFNGAKINVITNNGTVALADDFAGTGGDRTYTVTVEVPDVEAVVSVTLLQGAAQDLAGNDSAARSETIIVDHTPPARPTVSSAPSADILGPFTIQLNFAESVVGALDLATMDFALANLTFTRVTNGAAVNSYILHLTPMTAGAVTLDLNAGAVSDAAGNGIEATSGLFTGTANPTDLTASIQALPAVAPEEFTITVRFGAAVTGFDNGATDVSIASLTGGSAIASDPLAVSSPPSGTVAGQVYTVAITATVEELLTITIPAGVATEIGGGRTNVASEAVTTVPDLTRPMGSITPNGNVTHVNADFGITIEFDEPVIGFDVAKIHLGGGVANSVLTSFTPGVPAGQVYRATVDIPDDANGTLSMTIAAADAPDAVGLTPTADIAASVTVDTRAPTVEFDRPTPTVPVAGDFTVGIRFDEDVTGFDETGITVTNGAKGAFVATDARTYTLAVVAPATSDDVVITVNADAASDIAGNFNAEESVTVTVDRTGPTPMLTADPVVDNVVPRSFTLSIDFNEAVTGFTTVGIDGGGATVASSFTRLDAANGEFGVMVTVPDATVAEGEAFTIAVPAGAAEDSLGNGNPATSITFTVDGAAPTVEHAAAVSNTPDSVTEEFGVGVTFNEEVFGVDADSFTVSNGELTSVTRLPNTNAYVVRINPTANGDVVLALVAGGATDRIGNAAAANPNVFTIRAGLSPLTATIIGSGTQVGSTFECTVTFNAPIDRNSLTPSDFEAVGATPIGLAIDASNPTRVFYLTFRATADGEVTVRLPAGRVAEAGGTGVTNRAANPIFVGTADVSGPQITSVTPAEGSYVTEDFVLTVIFDDDVSTSFTTDDIEVGSGAGKLDDFTATTPGRVFTVTVTLPATDGVVTISIPAGAAQNAAGLPSARLVRSVNVDRMAPVAEISGEHIGGATNADFEFTVTFTDGPVTAFDANDIVLSGVTPVPGKYLRSVVPGERYIVSVTLPDETMAPELDATMTITIPASQVMDAAGFTNAEESDTLRVDRVAPMIESMESGISGNIPGVFPLTITFNEPVTGLLASEVSIAGGEGANLAGTSAGWSAGDPDTVFRLVVTPTGDGPLVADIAANLATDLAGNGNAAYPSEFQATVELAKPTVIVGPDIGVGNSVGDEVYVNTDTFVARFTFSSDVTGFNEATDVMVTNGVAGQPSPVDDSASIYTTIIIPNAGEEVPVTVGVAVDTASTASGAEAGNVASALRTFVVDRARPTAAIEPIATLVSGAFEVTITFSEKVTGFTAEDLVVSGGAKGVLTGTAPASEYTITVFPAADGSDDGELTLDVVAGVAQDLARNDNTAAAQRTVVVDTIAPTAVEFDSDAPATVTGAFEVDVEFSEAVIDFAASDLTVMNAMVAEPTSLNDDRTMFTVPITPMDDGEVVVRLAARAVADYAGNRNTAASRQIKRVADLPVVAETPTSLTVTGGRGAIVLDWTAPAEDGGADITGYLIEYSATGRLGSWAILETDTQDAGTTYRHGGLGEMQTLHYRVSAINASGNGDASDAAFGTTLPPINADVLDANADGRVTADDALIFQYWLNPPPADAAVRRTLIGPFLRGGIDRSNTVAVDAAIAGLLAPPANLSALDVNGDGQVDADDATIVHHVKAFPELVGNGRTGTGFREFREALIMPYLASGVPQTDEEMRRIVRFVRNL